MDVGIKISIVIPIYNVEKYVAKTIESVLSQQIHENYEIILVDDGSTDKSGQICDSYAYKNKDIIVIHKTNGGVMSARDAGIDASRGEYICFLDGDDRMPPNALNSFYNAAITYNVDYINGCDTTIDIDGNRILPVGTPGFKGIIKPNKKYRSFIARHPRGMNLKMYRKEVLTREPRVQIDSHITNNEDLIFNLFLSSKIDSVMSIDDIVVNIVSHSDSVSHRRYSEDYWLYVLNWLDQNYKKYDVYIDDLVLYKLHTIKGKFLFNSKVYNFSNICFDNIRDTKYKLKFGTYNIYLYIVKHPYSLLARFFQLPLLQLKNNLSHFLKK